MRSRLPVGRTSLFWMGAGIAGAIGTIALALTSAAGSVTVPIAVQQIVDQGRSSGPGVIGTLLLASAVMGVSAIAAYWLTVRLVRRTETALDVARTEAFRHLVERAPAGSRSAAAQRIIDDIERISQFVRWGRPHLLLSAGQVVVAIGVMVFYSWELTLVVAIAVAPLAMGCGPYRRRVLGAVLAIRKLSTEVRATITELVLRSRQAHGEDERRRVQERVDGAAARRRAHQLRMARIEGVGQTARELTIGLVLASVIAAGSVLGATQQITLGQLTAFVLVMVLAAGPAQATVAALQDGRLAKARWRRIIRSYLREVATPQD